MSADGKTTSVKTQQGRGFTLELLVSEDQLTAKVRLTKTQHAACSAADIVAFVHGAGIKLGKSDDAHLTAAAEKLASSQGTAAEVVCHGVAAKPWLAVDWRVPLGEHQHAAEAHGLVDLHEVTRFANAHAGQKLCVLPAAPAPGHDVFGHALAPPPPPVRAGKDVGADPLDPHCLIAQRDGCARLVEGVLSVEEQLDIKGDLDFKVGNIDFWGAVVIHGSVLDDFHVKATKSVVVEGSVGMATLEAGADLTIKGGVNGARKAKLTCGGTLRSRFLHGARADAGGDISIEVECIDSVLHAGGDIRVVRGGIIGGEARAKGNVEAAVLGSELCVPTILAAGHTGSGAHDPHAAAHLADLDEADELVSKTGAELAKITGSGKSVPAAQRERHAALQGHLAEAQEKAHRVRRELAELSRQHGGTGAVIKAAKAAHPRVSVTVGGVYSQVLASELKGPVTFSADLEKGALKVQARKATDQAVEHVEGESDPAERWRWGPAVLLGGLFVSLLLSWTPAMRLQSEVRPLKVASCEVVDDYAGSARARVKSKAGQTLELGWEELASPQECLAEGTVVEKRRGAFDYTYGGVAFEWPRRGTRLLGPLGVLLSLLLFAAAALGKRLAIQRAAAGPPHQGSG